MSKAKFSWDDGAVRAKVEGGSRRAIDRALRYVGRESQAQVPLDQGALQRSMKTEIEGDTGSIGYGETDTGALPYALKWHEQDANFQRGRKSHYLQDPLYDPQTVRELEQGAKEEIDL